MSKLKKIVEEAKDIPNAELDLVDRGISRLDDVPGLCKKIIHRKDIWSRKNSYRNFVYF